MHYDTRQRRPAGLTHDPFKALLVPRPIGWIGTVDAQGRPNRLRPASKGRFKRFGRCIPPLFCRCFACRVRGAVGKEEGHLKRLSSERRAPGVGTLRVVDVRAGPGASR
jgi:hypothetical protein